LYNDHDISFQMEKNKLHIVKEVYSSQIFALVYAIYNKYFDEEQMTIYPIINYISKCIIGLHRK